MTIKTGKEEQWKKQSYLVNDAHVGSQPVWTKLTHVGPVNLHGATGWVIEPHQQCCQSGFARATGANHCRYRATGHYEIKTVKDGHFGPRWVTEVNVVELNVTQKVCRWTVTFCNM